MESRTLPWIPEITVDKFFRACLARFKLVPVEEDGRKRKKRTDRRREEKREEVGRGERREQARRQGKECGIFARVGDRDENLQNVKQRMKSQAM